MDKGVGVMRVNIKGEKVEIDPTRPECALQDGVHVNPCNQCTGCTNPVGLRPVVRKNDSNRKK